jgi:hypothetical protein
MIVIFENNTDPGTLEHELVHAVEYKFESTPALLELFEKAKEVIDEGTIMTDTGFVDWNFTKNIHEFIAEGRTKLVPALKEKGLYEDFLRETAYILMLNEVLTSFQATSNKAQISPHSPSTTGTRRAATF